MYTNGYKLNCIIQDTGVSVSYLEHIHRATVMKSQTVTVFPTVAIIVYSDMRQLTQGQTGEIIIITCTQSTAHVALHVPKCILSFSVLYVYTEKQEGLCGT